MIYAEWTLYGVLDNGIFTSWGEYYDATFSPEINVEIVRVIK